MIVNYDNIQSIKDLNKKIAQMKKDKTIKTKEVSDTYHTFGDLYEHRMVLTASLCHFIKESMNDKHRGIECYKSKKHSDGTMFDGNFIVVIEQQDLAGNVIPGTQISYHYNEEHWDKFDIPVKEKANEYDGHTPEDCVERLLKLAKF